MGTLWQDIRHGLRVLARNPGFTMVAVLILALGIGAATAVFSVVNTFILNPVPLPDQERLGEINTTFKTRSEVMDVSPKAYLLLEEHPELLERLTAFKRDGLAVAGGDFIDSIPGSQVTPTFFAFFGTQPALGRCFSEQDVAGAKRVVVINETMAHRYWSGTDPVGQSLDLGMAIEPGYAPVEIVGVVGDVKYDDMAAPFGNDIYVPYLQSGYPVYCLTVRTAGDPLSLAAPVRQAVAAVQRELPVSNVMTMTQRVANSTSRTRFIAVLLAVFAALALVLAVTGLYGLIAYSVAQRTREIGIRMALGAESSQVLCLTLRQGMRLVVLGGVIGVAAALALTRLMRSLLYEVSAADPLTFAAVALLLALAALLACYLPARRAARIDPMVALRYE